MEPSQVASPQMVVKHACSSCSRRKIRCDRRQPCTNCVSHGRISARKAGNKSKDVSVAVDCVYVDPPPVQRHRRRVAPQPAAPPHDLLDRLRMYEDLLQKNNIATDTLQVSDDITGRHHRQRSSGDDAADRTWIASPWESRMPRYTNSPSSSGGASATETPLSAADTLEFSEATTETGVSSSPPGGDDTANEELGLWQSLAPELRNLPVSGVFARRFFGHDPGALSSQPAINAGLLGVPGLAERVQHPDPRTILRLWQMFVDNVNPLVRIVHVPTTSQQVLDASWDAANATPATGALLFAVYALSLMSLSAAEFADIFPQNSHEKSELLSRYRMGAMQCLVAAGLMTTRRVDVLRAFTLLILAEPNSEVASSLASLAVHLGLKMGLHLEPSSAHSPICIPGLSFFEREMRVRLWWQIRGLNTRLRQAVNLSVHHSNANEGDAGDGETHSNHACGLQPRSDVIEIRLPLNVNDADLHPDMTTPPVEHTGPTEMMYVRMKYETALWMRSFAQNQKQKKTSAAAKYQAIDDLETTYAQGCLRHCDLRIPLHAVTAHMARMAVAQMRFQAYHPRLVSVSPSFVFTRERADATFQHALEILETCFTCRHVSKMGKSFVAFQLLADIVLRVVMDALVYVVCMLRVRGDKTVDKIDTAWRLIESFYDEYGDDMAAAVTDYHIHLDHPHGGDDTADHIDEGRKLAAGAAFVTAFTDLVLDAWNYRGSNTELGETIQAPDFILRLQEQQQARQAHLAGSDTLPADTLDWMGLVSQEEQCMDWGYWNNLMQI